MDNSKIRIALLGLNDIGETFAEHFLEKIHTHDAPVEIVAVADHNIESPVALGFSQNGVPVFKNPAEVTKMGDKIDIIFDLTGNTKVRQELRLGLLESKNKHTLIANEMFANLLWCFFDEPGKFRTATSY